MAFYTTHRIAVKNWSGNNTTFLLQQDLISNPGPPTKLPLVDKPVIIEGSATDLGIGPYNYRCSITIDNDYNDDFIAIINSIGPRKIQLLITIDFGGDVKTVFRGFLDFDVIDRNLAGPNLIDLDFLCGSNQLTDSIFDSEQITTTIPEYYNSRQIIMDHLLSKIFFQDGCGFNDEVLYAYGSDVDERFFGFEAWRIVLNYFDQGTLWPTCIFIDLAFNLRRAYEKEFTYREVLADLCQIFQMTVGYSQLQEMATVHFSLEGADGRPYRLIKADGTIFFRAQRNLSNYNYTPISIELGDFEYSPKPKETLYPPIASLTIERPGPDTTLSTIGNVITPVQTSVTRVNPDNIEYAGGDFEYNFSWHSYGDTPLTALFVKDEDENYDFTSIQRANRVLRFIDESPYDYYHDIIEYLADVIASQRFKKRKGLKFTTKKWIDPIFPFNYTTDNKRHRVVKSRQDVINFDNHIESIEIYPLWQ